MDTPLKTVPSAKAKIAGGNLSNPPAAAPATSENSLDSTITPVSKICKQTLEL